ncbi:MAG: hypothetical protein IPP13_08095 [Kouleothrix sp.]|jgi:hypothetical protein|nr:hypothetical protein [Kouleothrix sp.]
MPDLLGEGEPCLKRRTGLRKLVASEKGDPKPVCCLRKDIQIAAPLCRFKRRTAISDAIGLVILVI